MRCCFQRLELRDLLTASLLADINPDPVESEIDIAEFQDGVLALETPISSRVTGLWKSDGTNDGTERYTEIATDLVGAQWAGQIGDLLVIDGGSSLWVTDGTENGTKMLTSAGEFFGVDIVRENEILFAAESEFGLELWRSDGTDEGTFVVRGHQRWS